MRFRICLVAAVLGIWATASFGAEFKAGAAFRMITPDPLLPVSGGIGTPEPVTEKKGDLFARAVVLEKGDERVAIVSVDNLGIPSTLAAKARAQITQIPADHVLIGATHTHSAPDAYCFPDQSGQHHADLEYLDWMCAMIAEAVNEAIEKLEPADVRIDMQPIADRIAWNAYAPALFDPRCSVLQALAKDGNPIFTLVNYAVHPEVLGPDRGILSPDLCGPLYERIAEKGGGMGIFMNSAQGGMVTADCRNPDGEGEIQTWEECIRIGNLLADEALRVISAAPIQQDPELAVFAKTANFPVESELMRAIVELSPVMEIKSDNSVDTTLNLINVGTAQIITIPGEALPNIGAYLKRNMPTPHPFLFGLTNDAFGYILVKEDWGAFRRYEYISRTSLGEHAGETFVNEALELIGEAPPPAAG